MTERCAYGWNGLKFLQFSADGESLEDLRTDADRYAAVIEGLHENALYRYATTQQDSLQHSRPHHFLRTSV